jgi:hypothetical protein
LIELTDPKWSDLPGNYGNGAMVAELIARAKAGAPIDEWYEDLFQSLCHQYTVSVVAYAAAPHLVKIAGSPHSPRLKLLILLGTCYAFSDQSGLAPIPDEFKEEWYASARSAIPLLAELLAEAHSSEAELLNLLSAMAAFNGHHSLARAIEAFDTDIE